MQFRMYVKRLHIFLPRFEMKNPKENNVIVQNGNYYLIWHFFIILNE